MFRRSFITRSGYCRSHRPGARCAHGVPAVLRTRFGGGPHARPRPERRRDRRRHSIDRCRRSGRLRRPDGRAAQRLHRRRALAHARRHCSTLRPAPRRNGSCGSAVRRLQGAEHRRRNGAQRRCVHPASGLPLGRKRPAALRGRGSCGGPGDGPAHPGSLRDARPARRGGVEGQEPARHLRLRRLRADRRRARSGLLRHAPSRVGQVARRQELGPGVPPLQRAGLRRRLRRTGAARRPACSA